LAPEFPVGINEFEKLVAVLTLDQTQLGLFIYFVVKRVPPRSSDNHAKSLLIGCNFTIPD
jgi:hypothetical protein